MGLVVREGDVGMLGLKCIAWEGTGGEGKDK